MTDSRIFSRSITATLGLGLLIACVGALADEAATIRGALAKIIPDHKVTSVRPTPIDGLYQVDVGPQVMFVTGDGRYLIDGAVIDLKTREDISAKAEADARRRAMESVGEDNMVVFSSPTPKHQVTVFTDIDCGYCRKLHSQIADYESEGITVRYMFYPRSGIDSPSYKKAVSVWCADDQRTAMTEAKNGKPIPEKTCSNPVKRHMELGEMMGIRGTPAIVLENGDMVPGYVEPKRLALLLENGASN
jgi:thiol:disulfide interchange protein DsbC